MKVQPGEVHIQRQPTETSCGPTCLQALYAYYGVASDIHTIADEVIEEASEGTLAVNLGKHALLQGFSAKIYSYNLAIFDPTWFHPRPLSSGELIENLKQQKKYKKDRKLHSACNTYMDFLEGGGEVMMEDLSEDLLIRYLKNQIPLLTGLSSTYLYRAAREFVHKKGQVTDDIRGTPEGHFVIIEKYDPQKELATIADPFATNPFSHNLRYSVPLPRLVTSILLGVLTYDANFLVIQPKETPNKGRSSSKSSR